MNRLAMLTVVLGSLSQTNAQDPVSISYYYDIEMTSYCNWHLDSDGSHACSEFEWGRSSGRSDVWFDIDGEQDCFPARSSMIIRAGGGNSGATAVGANILPSFSDFNPGSPIHISWGSGVTTEASMEGTVRLREPLMLSTVSFYRLNTPPNGGGGWVEDASSSWTCRLKRDEVTYKELLHEHGEDTEFTYIPNHALPPGRYRFTMDLYTHIIPNGFPPSMNGGISLVFSAGFATTSDWQWCNDNWCLDPDGDNSMTASDLISFAGAPIDINRDGVIDPDPFGVDAAFLADSLLAYDESIQDCDESGFPDFYEIMLGVLEDSDDNGIPDQCEPACLADLAEPYGLLDLADIVAFVTAFSDTDPAADLNTDGLFDLQDVVMFVDAFTGDCM